MEGGCWGPTPPTATEVWTLSSCCPRPAGPPGRQVGRDRVPATMGLSSPLVRVQGLQNRAWDAFLYGNSPETGVKFYTS